jgi:hypothetical protein
LELDQTIKNTSPEVGDIGWYSYEEALKKIQANKEGRKKLLRTIYDFLRYQASAGPRWILNRMHNNKNDLHHDFRMITDSFRSDPRAMTLNRLNVCRENVVLPESDMNVLF